MAEAAALTTPSVSAAAAPPPTTAALATAPPPTTTGALPGPSAETPRPTTTRSDAGSGDTGPNPGSPSPTRPDWLGSRVLATNENGLADAQTTPPELVDRRLPTVDTIAPPADRDFSAEISPLGGDPLARSTWTADCPVSVAELSYLQVSFWGFDNRPHQGELIVNATVADDIVGVFRTLFEARFPLEEMRIVTPADLDAPPTGDGNNTTSFVCRAVVGGTRFSEHAFGLAVDINPFHNPYQKGEVVLPELATSYLDRDGTKAGVIVEGGVVVESFDAIGWGWGGRWQSLSDNHHFSFNNR